MDKYYDTIMELIIELQEAVIEDFTDDTINSDGVKELHRAIDRFQTDFQILSQYLNNHKQRSNHNG
jgi:hypothetical protein